MQVAVMGPLEVRTDDLVPVLVPGGRERLLLALLVARSPRAVGIDELAETLWGGQFPEDAPRAVRAVVLGLRAALEPRLPVNVSGRYVLRRGPGYALALPGGEIDAERFVVLTERAHGRLAADDAAEAERLATTALGLWRGTPYVDWPDVALFDEERRRLHAARAVAEAAIVEARSRPATEPATVPAATGAFLVPVPVPIPPPVRIPVPAARTVVPAPRPELLAPEIEPVPPPVPDSLVPEPISQVQPRRLLLLALLLVGALVATVVAVRSQQPDPRRPAVDAETVSLRDEAERLADLSATEGPLDISLLLAVQAFRLDESSGTRNALRAVLLGHPRAQRVGRIPGTPQVAMLSGPVPTLLLATETDVVVWPVTDHTQPQVLIPIPREWGVWSAAIPSPTDAAFVAVGQHEDVPWVRMVSASDGASRLLAVGDLPGGRPVDGVVAADGRRIVLLVAEALGTAPQLTARWRVIEVDATDGAVRDTGITGTAPFPMGTLAVDFAHDAGSLVLWDRFGDTATLVDLVDGRQTPVTAPPNATGTMGFRALPGGAAQLGGDGEITLIDRDSAVLQVLDAHSGPLTDVAISPDGTWVVSASDGLPDGELYRWTVDPATGRWSSPEALTGHRGAVLDVEADVTGRLLVSVAGDGTAISWDMGADAGGTAPLLTAEGDELLAAACAIVGRDFTEVEWSRYLPDRPFAPTCSDLF